MNVLFIFSRHSKDPRDSTLTKDLADAFFDAGVNVYVMTMSEARDHNHTGMSLENGYNVLRVRTGNYFNCNTKLEKIKTILEMPGQFIQAAKKHLYNIKIDLIITHTPFVSSKRVINPLKKMFQCKAHLILWDIFPQNAWDIGIIQNKFLFRFFKHQEIKMLRCYEQIWCMSNGNIDYMRINYPELMNIKMGLLYNSAKIKSILTVNKSEIRAKFGYLDSDIIAIFGGNMGVPQSLENILDLASLLDAKIGNAKFLFVGSGTETNKLKNIATVRCLSNVKFIDQIPRNDYENIMAIADIGLVSLDQRFTVPNFPSKTTDYFKFGIPVLASLDDCSSRDYGHFLTEITNGGLFARAGNVNDLLYVYMELYSNASLRKELGTNGRRFYETELGSMNAFKKIRDSFNSLE